MWSVSSPSPGRWAVVATPGPSRGATPVRLTATYAHPRYGTVEDLPVSVRPGSPQPFAQAVRRATAEGAPAAAGGLLIGFQRTKTSTAATASSRTGPLRILPPTFVALDHASSTNAARRSVDRVERASVGASVH